VGFGQTTWEEFVEWIKDSIKDKGNRLIDAATAYASAKQKEHQTIDEFLFYLDPIEAQLEEKTDSNRREALFGKLRKDIVAELLRYERQPHTRQELISAVRRIETSKKLQTEWDQQISKADKRGTRKDTDSNSHQDRHSSRQNQGPSTPSGPGYQKAGPATTVNRTPLGSDNKHNPNDKRCYRCQSTSHIANNCPEVECFNCREKGHVSTNCTKPKRLGNGNAQS
jgi:hypothetical protein